MIGRGRSDRETEANRTAAEQGPVPSPVRRSVSSFRVGRTCCCRKRAFCVQDVLIDDSIPTPLFSHKPSLRSPFPIQRVNTHAPSPFLSVSVSLSYTCTQPNRPVRASPLTPARRPPRFTRPSTATDRIDRSIDRSMHQQKNTHARTHTALVKSAVGALAGGVVGLVCFRGGGGRRAASVAAGIGAGLGSTWERVRFRYESSSPPSPDATAKSS